MIRQAMTVLTISLMAVSVFGAVEKDVKKYNTKKETPEQQRESGKKGTVTKMIDGRSVKAT